MAVTSDSSTSTPLRAFIAICWRDIFVTGRQFPVFLAQVLLQPIFLLFVFGRILPQLGFASAIYATLLLPGIVSLSCFLTAIQATALPLVLEFSFTKEIEDRLLAPLPVGLLAIQKMIIASVRGLVAGAVIFPLGVLIIGGTLHLSSSHIGLVVLFSILAALVGSAVGMTMGTLVEATQINVMFAVIFTPLFFTGCTQYPWAQLDELRWFQIVTLFNPMTYASEGLRGSLVPGVRHMGTGPAIGMLLLFLVVFGAVGIWGFVRRAID